jgi:histidine triad (HIT) family protein
MQRNDCVFCRIAMGKAPAHKVYEDEKYLGFLTIDPKTRGHTLLIPKEHHRWTYDVPAFGEYWEVARKVGLACRDAMEADAISFLTLGFEVPHAHIWIIPRKNGDGHGGQLNFALSVPMTDAQFEETARKIRQTLYSGRDG